MKPECAHPGPLVVVDPDLGTVMCEVCEQVFPVEVPPIPVELDLLADLAAARDELWAALRQAAREDLGEPS